MVHFLIVQAHAANRGISLEAANAELRAMADAQRAVQVQAQVQAHRDAARDVARLCAARDVALLFRAGRF